MPIEIAEELVNDAQAGHPAALSAVICACYPSICRIAIAVGGDTRRGLALVQDLVRGSLQASAGWNDPAAPWRWFLHHTILNLRRSGPATGPDPLVQYSAGKDVPFVAFVSALRKLPPQQVEAFILRHGEQMKERELAVAMDCSTTAAVNHLTTADAALKLVAAGDFDARLAEFRAAYGNLSPDPDEVKKYVLSRVQTRTTRRRTGRAIKWIAWLILIAVIAVAAWRALEYMSA